MPAFTTSDCGTIMNFKKRVMNFDTFLPPHSFLLEDGTGLKLKNYKIWTS